MNSKTIVFGSGIKYLFPFLFIFISAVAFNQDKNPDLPDSPKGRFVQTELDQSSLKDAIQTQLINTKGQLILIYDFDSSDADWEIPELWNKSEAMGGYEIGIEGDIGNDIEGGKTTRLVSPKISLPFLTSSKSHLALQFEEKFYLENDYDFGYVEISKDQGQNWIVLDVRSGLSDWRNSLIILDTYAGEEILLGFRYEEDDDIPSKGWSLANVQISLISGDTGTKAGTLTSTLQSLSPHNFPFIYMNVSVKEDGIGLPSLTQSNFSVYENNTLQTNYFEVTPPTQGGGSRLADIVFLVDNSGSFDKYQVAVYNNMVSFIAALKLSDIDYALGLCRFGQAANYGNPILEESGRLTTDADYFRDDIWSRNLVDGRYEPAYDAIYQSVSGFTFRPGSQKIFIILADENPNQGTYSQQDAINSCVNNSVTLFSLTTTSSAGLNLVATSSNGRYYNITDPFTDILNDISTVIGDSYLVRYKSSNSANDATQRNVKVEIDYDGSYTEVTGSYFPGSAPSIARTQATINLENTAWAEYTQFTIEAEITDNITPFTSAATLFYKATSSSNWKSLPMTNISGNIWRVQVPTSEVIQPGIDYYITATDGQLTSSAPSVQSSDNPYQIAILPNVKPAIIHTPITDFTANSEIEFIANVVDVTNALDRVNIYIRNIGQLLYREFPMSAIGSNNYRYRYQTGSADNAGIEYYIAAWDNFNVMNSRGTADHPNAIQVIENELPVITHTPPQEYIVNGSIDIIASASDPDGSVSRMWIYLDDLSAAGGFVKRTMTKSSGNSWKYEFSASSSQNRGIRYYFEAEDNEGGISTLDKNNPFEVNPRPNQKPEIDPPIIPVEEKYIIKQSNEIRVFVNDPDGTVQSVFIHINDLSKASGFVTHSLQNVTGKFYNWMFTPGILSDEGYEYYITAVDDQGETGYFGNAANPVKLWPVWTNGFNPTDDGWEFINDEYWMWNKDWWSPPRFDYSQRPPYPRSMNSFESERFPDWPLFVEVFGAHNCYIVDTDVYKLFSPSAVLKWTILSAPSIDKSSTPPTKSYWEGSCFGFATSSYMAYHHKTLFNNSFPDVGYQSKLSALIHNYDRAKCINNLQISQYGSEHLLHSLSSLLKPAILTLAEIKLMFTDSFDDDRVLVMVNQNGSGAHAVNAYKIERDKTNPDIEYIYIYDNNNIWESKLDNKKIKIDKSKNTWSYIFDGTFKDWGGWKGLFLMEPVSSYFIRPTLPFSTRDLNDYLELFIFSSENVNIVNSGNKSIGYKDSIAFNDLENGMPIIPITGSFHKPIGYFLPNDDYKIELTDFSDTISSYSVFTESVVYSYSRDRIQEGEVENFIFGSNSKKKNELLKNSTIKSVDINDGQISNNVVKLSLYDFDEYGIVVQNKGIDPQKDININTIVKLQGEEHVFIIGIDSIIENDEIFINTVNGKDLVIYNNGSKKDYNIKLQITSLTIDTVFIVPEKINIDESHTHLIKSNSDDGIFGAIVLVDTDQDGTFSDTIKLSTEINVAPAISDVIVYINENLQTDDYVTYLAARDPDEDQDLYFSILSGNINDAFRINLYTGEIYVNNPAALDYETNPVFTLEIMVRDNGQGFLSDTAIVTIKLIDLIETAIHNIPGLEAINVYPNPFEDQFIIEADFRSRKDISLHVFNALGKIIYQDEFAGVNHIDEAIDIGDMPSGLYFLKLSTDQGNSIFKLEKY